MAEVRLTNLEKVYPGDVHAVTDLTLTIADGEFVVLVGPSGCGKSTVLRMLAGLEEVTGGEIHIGKQRVNALSPQERDMAMVFQNYALYPHKTVRGNLDFPLRMMGIKKDERRERVSRVAEQLGLTRFLDQRPKQLSGGQRQRVAMGRAMVREPQVFLLDEPLSNLDAKLRVRIRTEIAELQRSLGVTTLYVTHDQIEAMTLGDRVAVLCDGKLQQVGTGNDLYERPANLFVAGFIGSPRMNIFKARLRHDEEGRRRVSFGRSTLTLPEQVAASEVLEQIGEGELFLGLRPEAFQLVEDASEQADVRAEVVAVESLGHESLIYTHADAELHVPDSDAAGPDSETLVVRLPGHNRVPQAGDEVALQVDLDLLHVFDSEGNSLTTRDS